MTSTSQANDVRIFSTGLRNDIICDTKQESGNTHDSLGELKCVRASPRVPSDDGRRDATNDAAHRA